jgi:hypothetical protein
MRLPGVNTRHCDQTGKRFLELSYLLQGIDGED